MKLLLDTHTFLWFAAGNSRIPPAIRDRIADTANPVFVSAATLREIAIKVGIGKLSLGEPFEQFIPKEMQRNRIELLPIAFTHIARIVELPPHHRDPFDRLLVAQALVEGLPLVSADPLLDAYPITRLW